MSRNRTRLIFDPTLQGSRMHLQYQKYVLLPMNWSEILGPQFGPYRSAFALLPTFNSNFIHEVAIEQACADSADNLRSRVLSATMGGFIRWPLQALVILNAIVKAAPCPGTLIERQEDLLDSYDYVVVGGGVSGLTVANRLTEDPQTTVLVIEAGKIDNLEPRMVVPKLFFYASAGNQWSFVSERMPELNNRTHNVWSAKVLGGGSAINRMMFNRGAAEDYDTWGELIEDTDNWSWKALLPYFKKSENFTPPSRQQIQELGVTYDLSAHGNSGPVQSSFPPFIYEIHKYFFKAARELGLPTPREGASGEAIGAIWTTNSVHATLGERSYARNSYHVISAQRPNYHVLANNTVTKIVNEYRNDGSVLLTGVEYVSSAETNYTRGEKHVVRANKEILMAAGALHTPRLLQLSGIGSSQLLCSVGINPIIDLPGVGENFHDHANGNLQWSTNYKPSDPIQDPASFSDPVFNATMTELYYTNRTGPLTVSTGNSLGYWTTEHIRIKDSTLEALDAQDPATYLRKGVHSSIIAGFAKQKDILVRKLRKSKIAAVEMTFSATSTVTAIMHPLSRGYIHIQSDDPLQPPVIDFRPLTNPFDWEVALASVRWQQEVFSQAPTIKQELGNTPTFPAPGIGDEELKQALGGILQPSWAHLVGTCAMLKKEDGGCVDSSLRVYGAGGRLRVVDASIIPVIPGTHTQSTVYAVAEKMADLIKCGK